MNLLNVGIFLFYWFISQHSVGLFSIDDVPSPVKLHGTLCIFFPEVQETRVLFQPRVNGTPSTDSVESS